MKESTFDSREEKDASKLDNETRIYLKRLRDTCPDADITFPDGFYDTDDELEARAKAALAKKFSSKHLVCHVDSVNKFGRPQVERTHSSKLQGFEPHQQHKDRWQTGETHEVDTQVLEARSVSKSDKQLEAGPKQPKPQALNSSF